MPDASPSKFRQLCQQAQSWLSEPDLESPETGPVSAVRRFVHFWVLVINSFLRNRCPVRAEALAYTTLLALIPLLAVTISVTTSLLKTQEGEKQIQQLTDRLISSAVPQLDLLTKADEKDDPDLGGAGSEVVQMVDRQEVSKRIQGFIGNVRSGTLGVTGIIGLVMVAILLLSRIETTFNDIWGVTQGRSWFSRVVQYWTAITLGPVVLLAVIGLNLGSHLETFIRFLPFLGSWVSALVPFVVLSLAFALFYRLMPNTTVHWNAALVGGTVGGCLWQLNNLFNVIYMAKVVSSSKIYGSLGIVPVFLVGLYFSWIILLLGAQIAYAFQNRVVFAEARQAESVNQPGREFIALRLMTEAGRCFQEELPPPTATALAAWLGVPSRLVSQLLVILVRARLLSEIAGPETAYVPARPLSRISCQDILTALRASHGQDLPTRADPARELLREEFQQIQSVERQAAAKVTLQSLLARLSAGE